MRKCKLRPWLLAATIAFMQPLFAQVNFDQFKNYKPRNIGPAGMSGRVTAVDAVHANAELSI